MLSEEALVLVAAVGACALLILGILELVWPSRPRHPVRRLEPAPPAAKPAPVAAPKAVLPAAPSAPLTRVRRSKVSPHARSHAGQADRVEERPSLPAPVPPPLPPARPAPAAGGPAPTPPAPAPGAPVEAPEVPVPWRKPPPASAPAPTGPIDPLLLERCSALYQERHYDEVVSTGEEALARLRDTPRSTPEAHAAAALWSVVGLAKQAFGDHAGAGVALDAALRIAPAEERVTYTQHIADLALSAAQTALARAGNHDADNRVAEFRSALAWAERGLSAVPSDARLRGRHQTARAELWPAYEQSVHKLLRRQEFGEARRLLREALEDPEIPAARVAPFEELLSGTFAGEIGQLTAQAIRNMQGARESEALAALRRAEELLGSVPDEALPPKRREELDQRLLWGYTQLGVRRVEAGDHEAALDPLVRALKLAGIGPDRQAETRAALVRALEGVADVRALSIRELNDEGDRDGAVLRTQTLRELLRSCMELGLTAADLSIASARTQRLCEELGMGDRA